MSRQDGNIDTFLQLAQSATALKLSPNQMGASFDEIERRVDLVETDLVALERSVGKDPARQLEVWHVRLRRGIILSVAGSIHPVAALAAAISLDGLLITYRAEALFQANGFLKTLIDSLLPEAAELQSKSPNVECDPHQPFLVPAWLDVAVASLNRELRRLLACQCALIVLRDCRYSDPRSVRGIEMAEAHAQGNADQEDLSAAHKLAREAFTEVSQEYQGLTNELDSEEVHDTLNRATFAAEIAWHCTNPALEDAVNATTWGVLVTKEAHFSVANTNAVYALVDDVLANAAN